MVARAADRSKDNPLGDQLGIGTTYKIDWRQRPGMAILDLIRGLEIELTHTTEVPIAILLQSRGDSLEVTPLPYIRSTIHRMLQAASSLQPRPILIWADIPPFGEEAKLITPNNWENKCKKLNRIARGAALACGGDCVPNVIGPEQYWLFTKGRSHYLSSTGLDCLLAAWAGHLQELLL